ncbi:hypothetical protein F442_21530 [Phytophthora nicotianae P10297]|uniref:Uncharacterized protein n=1 Tax=Phytophthora nicotianae P10297 TaxID=1317064 RepID=W2Y3J3_PHYNI|nr:hypothetical protein F442_21530 [Phytophthora nicotianae P10297]
MKDPRSSAHWRLNNKGYVILHQYVTNELCDRFLGAANSIPTSEWSPVFGQGDESDGMDDKRLTAAAPTFDSRAIRSY